jgi:hypothetical protein
MLLSVFGYTSSLRCPDTVTHPGFVGCLSFLHPAASPWASRLPIVLFCQRPLPLSVGTPSALNRSAICRRESPASRGVRIRATTSALLGGAIAVGEGACGLGSGLERSARSPAFFHGISPAKPESPGLFHGGAHRPGGPCVPRLPASADPSAP